MVDQEQLSAKYSPLGPIASGSIHRGMGALSTRLEGLGVAPLRQPSQAFLERQRDVLGCTFSWILSGRFVLEIHSSIKPTQRHCQHKQSEDTRYLHLITRRSIELFASKLPLVTERLHPCCHHLTPESRQDRQQILPLSVTSTFWQFITDWTWLA